MPPAARAPLLRRLAFAVVAFALVLGGLEGALRLVLPVARRASLPNEMIQAHLAGAAYRYDPDLFWYWADPGVGGSPVNAYGFVRSKKMTRDKPNGVTRVITFGDSQTFGAGLQPDQTYSARAEQALGPGWEVLNAGMSGYRTLNVYRLLQLRMLAFQPDAVVIDCMPFDSPRDDGTLEGTPAVQSRLDAVRRVLWNSRLYYVLRLGLEVLDPHRARWLDDTHHVRGVPPPGGGGPTASPSTPGAPAPSGLTPDERIDLGNHDLIAAWGEKHGVAVFFMEYPIMDEEGRHGCMTAPGELPPGGRLIPTCARIQASGRPATALFQDRNHLTQEGATLVGGIVADALREWSEAR